VAKLRQREKAREALLKKFLEDNGLAEGKISPLADDCSFRRYFRVCGVKGNFIVMDAPPEKEETKPFIYISKLLNSFGYSAPRVLGKDILNGFLLLEDFGDETYTKALTDLDNEYQLYSQAVDVLIDLYDRRTNDLLDFVPPYDDSKLVEEALLFVDWYLIPRLKISLTSSEIKLYKEACMNLLEVNDKVPRILVLRDYHVDNLMVLPERKGIGGCGLLDFQDAVIGPAAYDLVSLLQDSRRDVSCDIVVSMLKRYFEGIGKQRDMDVFMSSYYSLGAQRALKVFGIFTRQDILYGNSRYIKHIPRLWRHLRNNLMMAKLDPLRAWIDHYVPENLIRGELVLDDCELCS
tara:strand:+ start:283 stop:1329 length:1047 start_codon:yes stop_codon:yes gene_type:complete